MYITSFKQSKSIILINKIYKILNDKKASCSIFIFFLRSNKIMVSLTIDGISNFLKLSSSYIWMKQEETFFIYHNWKLFFLPEMKFMTNWYPSMVITLAPSTGLSSKLLVCQAFLLSTLPEDLKTVEYLWKCLKLSISNMNYW